MLAHQLQAVEVVERLYLGVVVDQGTPVEVEERVYLTVEEVEGVPLLRMRPGEVLNYEQSCIHSCIHSL